MNYQFGWIPDPPSIKDYTFRNIKDQLEVKSNAGMDLPDKLSLRDMFSPIVAQGNLPSCTANAVAALVEFYERTRKGNYQNASRLFLYKTTRNLLKRQGASCVHIRATMGALALFGIPPEDYWPYTDDKNQFDQEPPAFCYALAANYKALLYWRHDKPGIGGADLLAAIKTSICSNNPVVFGFTVYSSLGQTTTNGGKIPFPSNDEDVQGNHAVVITGYDDTKEISNALIKNRATQGAFEIRNSIGVTWGENGYGWLPYEYVLKGLARDFWSLLKEKYVETDGFLKE
jgi:C1A family cysteine protease